MPYARSVVSNPLSNVFTNGIATAASSLSSISTTVASLSSSSRISTNANATNEAYSRSPARRYVGYSDDGRNNNVHNQNAHALIRIPSRIERPWSTGLFDCLSDVNSCFLTSLFPCITFGRIAEILDEGTISCGRSAILYILLWGLTFSPCLFTCLYRTKLRRKFLISETPCWDWIVHPLCQCCALCQEYRELLNRGFDMSIGYHENMALQNQTVAVFSTAPAVHTGTRR